MALDKKKLNIQFCEEAKIWVDSLEQGVLLLEKNPDQPAQAEILSALMGAAHTLKGTSQMLGFQKIQHLTHRMEDVLSSLKASTLTFSREIADALFAALDGIKRSMEGIRNGDAEAELDTTGLDKLLGNETQAPRAPASLSNAAPNVQAPAKDDFVRVPMSRVNTLLNLMGELVISKVKSSQKLSKLKGLSKKAKALGKLLENSSPQALLHWSAFCNEFEGFSDEFQAETYHLDPVIGALQQRMKELRMFPCSTIFSSFERLVRDMSHEQGKLIHFKIEGQSTELDKKVLDAIKGPLVHLLRNAVDHGIESGDERKKLGKLETATLTLSAFQEGDRVVIQVMDDGRGIDPEEIANIAVKRNVVSSEQLKNRTSQEILNLIFLKGFSTATNLTEYSGRGVGMDIVLSEVERLKGKIKLTSQKGQGTTLRMELPLTIAITQILSVQAGNRRYALRISDVEEICRVTQDDFAALENRLTLQRFGRTIFVTHLADVLGIPRKPAPDPQAMIDVVIVHSLDTLFGFIVERLLGEDEVFIKGLGTHLGSIKGISGVTILANGEVIPILDGSDLMRIAQGGGFQNAMESLAEPHCNKAAQTAKRILVVEDSLSIRELQKNVLESNHFVVETARDGLDALEKLAQAEFDIVVSDVQMPRMDGFTLCKNIKADAKLKKLPVIFLTTVSNEEDKRRGIEAGGQAYLLKSQFDQANLITLIERLT
ncbi:MAG: hybrid sensor histidine kinase/response regulator [Deltaproteobacteria bacterium]|nr:hybrid sensor histidine kinase/response regulator [Deltaproteobacteria bacterium]